MVIEGCIRDIACSQQVTLAENKLSDDCALPLLTRGTASGEVTNAPEQENR